MRPRPDTTPGSADDYGRLPFANLVQARVKGK